ncbi:MAG: SpoIIE family protein phosphatase [Chloroflexi bacterium]|nr:SpoIIE family protein phosphatase [Chloroflexota bacterium]
MVDQPDLHRIDPDHLVTLYQVSRTINSSLEFAEVLNSVMDAVMDATRAQRGFLMIADPGTHALEVRVARGVDDGKVGGKIGTSTSASAADGKAEEDSPYSTTIVRHVVMTLEPLLTNNAQFDERYTAGQSIILRGLRAILCVPMVVRERLVGLVYVDTAIRDGNFSDSDLQLLIAVAGQAAVAIENARLYGVAVEKGRLERELQMAREIQESLLPRQLPQLSGFDLAATWRSAREVAGDFYDAFLLKDTSLGLIVADVSDKGAPAALFMASARSMIRSHAFLGLTPVETLGQTNDLILKDTDSGMFVTAYYGVFQSNGHTILVNAGHNPPCHCRAASGEVTFLPRGGRAIGWFPNNPLKATELQLEPGDVLVLYTDGLTEAENSAGDFFGEARLAESLRQVADQPAEAILNHLIKVVDDFVGDHLLADDLTLSVVRYTGTNGSYA